MPKATGSAPSVDKSAASTRRKKSATPKVATKRAAASATSPTKAKPKGAVSNGPGAQAKAAKSPTRRSSATKPPADKFLAEQRAHLLAERESYVRHAESLKAEAEQMAQDMEPGDIQFDEESGEGATINIERERDLALSAQARGAVEEIDRALARLDAGTYGTCERCGEPIPKARLKVLPYAALCVACKSGGLSRR